MVDHGSGGKQVQDGVRVKLPGGTTWEALAQMSPDEIRDTPLTINGMMASADGPIKTFPLRGIKDTPPHLHDGRLLTLDDTVEFFNLVLGAQLTIQEKKDLVAFLRAL